MTLYRYERRSSPGLLFVGIAVVAAIIFALAAVQVTRGLPAPEVDITLPPSSVLGDPMSPQMPEVGAAIVAVDGLGTLGQSGPEEAAPIASVTKMMTAHIILRDHPLQPGESGPVIPITQEHVNRYWEMVALDHSVQPVQAGGSLSQLQLLQGLLVPSANNFGEILAVWDAGSIDAFVEKMNAEAQALGMAGTVYDDVSGFSDASVSTAADQLILARVAMENPVFAEIVGTESITLPAAGQVDNVNQLLGVSGIVGIKTGFTEQAGANLAFAARREAAGRTIDIAGVVMGQDDYQDVFDATLGIITSLNNGLQALRVVPAGQPVGVVAPDWGGEADIVVAEDVTMLVWPGMTMETTVEIESVDTSGKAGDQVGWLNVRLGEQEARVPLTLAEDIGGAGIAYRLTNF